MADSELQSKIRQVKEMMMSCPHCKSHEVTFCEKHFKEYTLIISSLEDNLD